MPRITVEVLKEAYEKTGLKPVCGKVWKKEDCNGICAIGVLAVRNGQSEGGYKYAEKVYGTEYVDGFWHAFDGIRDYAVFGSEATQLGYADGKRARIVLEPE